MGVKAAPTMPFDGLDFTSAMSRQASERSLMKFRYESELMLRPQGGRPPAGTWAAASSRFVEEAPRLSTAKRLLPELGERSRKLRARSRAHESQQRGRSQSNLRLHDIVPWIAQHGRPGAEVSMPELSPGLLAYADMVRRRSAEPWPIQTAPQPPSTVAPHRKAPRSSGRRLNKTSSKASPSRHSTASETPTPRAAELARELPLIAAAGGGAAAPRVTAPSSPRTAQGEGQQGRRGDKSDARSKNSKGGSDGLVARASDVVGTVEEGFESGMAQNAMERDATDADDDGACLGPPHPPCCCCL